MEMAMQRANVEEDREATMAHFLSSLRLEIAKVVELRHYVETKEMMNQAMKIEWRLKKKGQIRPSFNYQASYMKPSQPKKEDRASSSINTPKSKVDPIKGENKGG